MSTQSLCGVGKNELTPTQPTQTTQPTQPTPSRRLGAYRVSNVLWSSTLSRKNIDIYLEMGIFIYFASRKNATEKYYI
jgi:hypothetical protein